jgi:hypothetical protein
MATDIGDSEGAGTIDWAEDDVRMWAGYDSREDGEKVET